LLNSNAVEFIIVGGHAVAYHGYPRFTGDIDVWVRPTPENADRVLAALTAFGFDHLGLGRDDFTRPQSIVQLGRPPNRIDILSSVTGVGFDDAWAGREPGVLDGVPVSFVGRAELLRNKRATGRLKDLADVEEIEKVAAESAKGKTK
jgi:hypothetical protein